MSTERVLSPSLHGNPELDAWIRIDRDGRVHVSTGKVELGQGLRAAIARIAAEELDVALGRVEVHTADTGQGPVELPTVGSMSVEHSGAAVRLAAAEARQILLEAAARHLGAPVAALEVEDGVVRRRGEAHGVGYGALQGGRPFRRRITGEALPKPASAHRIVGRPGPRPDLRAKLTGGAFLHDLRLPGTLFGRVVRPPADAAELEAADEDAVRGLPGVVAVVRDGRFLGVVAEREEQAERARERLEDTCRWRAPETLPADQDLVAWLRAQPRESYPVVEGRAEARPVPPHRDPADASITRAASYARPFLMHGSIGPSAAIARWEEGGLRVWSHSQGVAMLRLALAEVLEVAPETIRVTHAEGPGCYGHNGADDAALDAALLARAVPGRPVLLQWSRADEHAWEPYGPAACVDVRASLDADGRIVDWSHEATSLTHVGRPMPGGEGSQLLAAWHLERPWPRPVPRARLAPEVGIHRNAWPAYAIPRVRVVKHLVPSRVFRTSSLRSLGAFANVFAIESFVDELAHAAGEDPVAFRLRHLDAPRARAVIEAAAERIGWRSGGGDGRGQGLAFARYANAKAWAAVAVELDVDRSHAIRLRRAVVAADAGQVVDPSGLANQLEGGLVQAASWTLCEEVRFDARRIRSTDWAGYPILGFADVPEVETVLLDHPDEPYLGAGEASQGPTPAAIANAVFHATGARLRRTPFTPDRLREARRASGAAPEPDLPRAPRRPTP